MDQSEKEEKCLLFDPIPQQDLVAIPAIQAKLSPPGPLVQIAALCLHLAQLPKLPFSPKQ
ncbi:hypothetical protein U1Q18_005074 [Sarracenia purpurea var. burkii]